MQAHFAHLRLMDWPFSVVPRPEHCTFIGGRPTLRDDIEELLRASCRRDVSSIRVFWSWLGAGKTHTLHYMTKRAHQLDSQTPPVQLHPLYMEFPRDARTFFDVYRAWVVGIGTSFLVEKFLEVATSTTSGGLIDEIRDSEPDLESAFRLITGGSQNERSVATHWLRGDHLPSNRFSRVGLSQRLAGTERAVTVMSLLIRLFNAAARSQGRKGHRMIWLIDEFQRLERFDKRARLDISTGLHSLFNSAPTGLTLTLSFTGPPITNQLPSWFSPELRSRVGTTKVMVLPPLSTMDAIQLVSDVLSHYRMEEVDAVDEFFPFTRETCKAIIEDLGKIAELRPRVIMHAFDAVLSYAEQKLEQREIRVISQAVAREALKDYVYLVGDEDHV